MPTVSASLSVSRQTKSSSPIDQVNPPKQERLRIWGAHCAPHIFMILEIYFKKRKPHIHQLVNVGLMIEPLRGWAGQPVTVYSEKMNVAIAISSSVYS